MFGSRRRRKTTNVAPSVTQDDSKQELLDVEQEQKNVSKSSFCWAEHVEEIEALESLEKELGSSENEDDRKRAEELNTLLSSLQKDTDENLSKAGDCVKDVVVEMQRCSSEMEIQGGKGLGKFNEKDTQGKLDVETPQLKDAHPELESDSSNAMFVEKDVDSVSIESFESCAETVIFVNEAGNAEGIEEIEIDRPCSQTELIILDDIKAHYDMEQAMLNSYQIDYTPEIIESIQSQFQNSLNLDKENEKGNYFHQLISSDCKSYIHYLLQRDKFHSI